MVGRNPVTRVRLLEADPDLGAALEGRELAAARRIAVPAYACEAGTHASHVAERPRLGAAAVILEGLLSHDVILAERTAIHLHGPGDVFDPWSVPSHLLRPQVVWTVHERTLIAVIDRQALAAVARHPQLVAALLERMADATTRMAVHQAISQLGRVEARILALMWHLADRWGRMGTDGVIVPLALTHETVGRLVGARRPTVSLALKELCHKELLQRRADGAWVLAQASAAELGAVGARRIAERAPQAAAAADGDDGAAELAGEEPVELATARIRRRTGGVGGA